jgi:hypothetical protein
MVGDTFGGGRHDAHEPVAAFHVGSFAPHLGHTFDIALGT